MDGRNRKHWEDPSYHCTRLAEMQIRVESLERRVDEQALLITGLRAQISAGKRAKEKEPEMAER